MRNDSESPISQKRKTSVAKPLETTVSNGRLDRHEPRICAKSTASWQLGHVTDHVSILEVFEEQESSQFPKVFEQPTTFVIDLFNTGTDLQRLFLKPSFSVRKTRSFF